MFKRRRIHARARRGTYHLYIITHTLYTRCTVHTHDMHCMDYTRTLVGMYICEYTCLQTDIHICIHTCIHTYINTYIHTYIHTYTDTQIHRYTDTLIHAFIHTCRKFPFKRNLITLIVQVTASQCMTCIKT